MPHSRLVDTHPERVQRAWAFIFTWSRCHVKGNILINVRIFWKLSHQFHLFQLAGNHLWKGWNGSKPGGKKAANDPFPARPGDSLACCQSRTDGHFPCLHLPAEQSTRGFVWRISRARYMGGMVAVRPESRLPGADLSEPSPMSPGVTGSMTQCTAANY